MSEGPEVKRTADKLSSLLVGEIIDKIIFRKAEFEEVIESLVGTSVEQIHTHGKNIIIQFSNGIFLRNHMMMWGKWRIYDRKQYDEGKAKPPPRKGQENHFFYKQKVGRTTSSKPYIENFLHSYYH